MKKKNIVLFSTILVGVLLITIISGLMSINTSHADLINNYSLAVKKETDIDTDESFKFRLEINKEKNIKFIKTFKNAKFNEESNEYANIEDFIQNVKYLTEQGEEKKIVFTVYLAKMVDGEWEIVEESQVFPNGWTKISNEEEKYEYEFGTPIDEEAEYRVFEKAKYESEIGCGLLGITFSSVLDDSVGDEDCPDCSSSLPNPRPSLYSIYDTGEKIIFKDSNEVISDYNEYLATCGDNCNNYPINTNPNIEQSYTSIPVNVDIAEAENYYNLIPHSNCHPPLRSNFEKPNVFIKSSDNNIYEFELKNGETFTLDNLPEGTEYEIWEETKEGWKLITIDGVQKDRVVSTLTENTTHTFVNEKEEVVNHEVPSKDTTTSEKPVQEQPKEEAKEFSGTKPEKIKTPLTVDKILIYSEIAVISLLVSGIMVMSIKRISK